MKLIDNFLNKITMYRLVLYVLIGLVVIAVTLSGFKIINYNPWAILFSMSFILLISVVSNEIFAKVYEVPANVESVYITGLILALIVNPVKSLDGLVLLFWVALLATASKYILGINHKHVFNPAAVAVAITSLALHANASWWVGNASMALPVAIGSLLIIRKIRREEMLAGFLWIVFLLTLGFGLMNNNLWRLSRDLLLRSSLLFFAGVMLTEPLTSPTKKNWQFAFGALVGFLFVPQVKILGYYFSPEQALIIGNIFAFIVSPKDRLILKLKEKIKIAPDIYDFVFLANKKINYNPGEYMEWTISGEKSDVRGNRRYFTLASSPTEDELRIGVKFYENGSSYKKKMLEMEDFTMVASQTAGEFLLPENKSEQCVLIAGGIGITPFRSMLKYLTDKQEKRDLVVIFVNNNPEEVVYKDVLEEAERTLGIKIIYYFTQTSGYLSEKNIPELVPDFKNRQFYISGPHGMVSSTEEVLEKLGVNKAKIKTDFFPGLA